MKPIKYIANLTIGTVLLMSCNKQIQEKEPNPNQPASVLPQLILGTVLNDMSGVNGASSEGALGGINSWDNVGDWNQYHCQNYNYYGNNIYSWTDGSLNSSGVTSTESNYSSTGPFNSYLVLKNVAQMQTEILSRGGAALNPYEAIGRFITAYYYYNMSSLMGDVPQVQALQSATNNLGPAYTSQEQVFLYVLNQLDTANSDFAALIAASDNTLSAAQDIYYGSGNNPNVTSTAQELLQWQKLVNSFKLRVLIALSNQSSDAALNVPVQFANIYTNPTKYPIFTSQKDDFEFVYNPGNSDNYSTYPFNPSNFGSIAGRFNMAYTYVNALTTISDPRVFMTCDPAWGLVDSTVKDPAQFQYFVGASTGEAIGNMYANASAGLYSFIGRYRYYSNFTGDPDVLVGYKEMQFNIAEAIERGWISGIAETYYKTGINESMKFYGIDTTQTSFTAYFLPPGANAVSQVAPYPFTFNFANYYAQPSVKLSSLTDSAIHQIVLQKYIVSFENSGYEAYYNWRRTGVPAFQGGSGVGNNGVVPKRWAYPVSEQTQNTKNWSAAIANQKFTADDLNQTMWLLQ